MIVEIDEERGIVLVTDETELDPNGEPTVAEYTIEEWNNIQSQ